MMKLQHFHVLCCIPIFASDLHPFLTLINFIIISHLSYYIFNPLPSQLYIFNIFFSTNFNENIISLIYLLFLFLFFTLIAIILSIRCLRDDFYVL